MSRIFIQRALFTWGIVQELIRAPVSELPPAIVETDELFTEKLGDAPLGEHMRRFFFINFDEFTFINHGAFGGVLRPAMRHSQSWRELCEAQPLSFLDRELFPQIVRVLHDVARFVRCSPTDLVLMPNATTGLCTVLSSLPLQERDVILTLSVGYGSVKRMVQRACEEKGCCHVEASIPFPVSREGIVGAVSAALDSHSPKLVVLDAVTSGTALALPLSDLVPLCQKSGAMVLVDGAHALGLLPLDLDKLGADFFVSNCHKWLSGPRGSAILHVRRDRQSLVRPLVVSWGAGHGFTSDFIWDGCRDYAPYLGLPAALRFWREVGAGRARQYMEQLRDAAVADLASSWGTSPFADSSLCAPGMALVRLPVGGAIPAEATSADAKAVQDSLHYDFRIECPVKCIDGGLYVRISAQIYNVSEDYCKLRDAVLQITLRSPAS